MSLDTSPIDPRLPEFALALYTPDDGDGDVEMILSVPQTASLETPASAALLHGLGIMMLDHQGHIARQVDQLFGTKPPSEYEAVRMINTLLLKDA